MRVELFAIGAANLIIGVLAFVEVFNGSGGFVQSWASGACTATGIHFIRVSL